MRSVDAVLCPHGLLSGVRHHDVFAAEWVFVISASNRVIGDSLTADDLRNLTWVAASGQSGGPLSAAAGSLPMRELLQAGIEPAIVMTTESYLLVPELVAGTDHVAVVPRSHARLVAPGLDLRVLESPVRLRPLTQALWWHPAFDDDPGHRWLRRTIAGLDLS
jgi:DNA-binding transcriptional LysR family regulator